MPSRSSNQRVRSANGGCKDINKKDIDSSQCFIHVLFQNNLEHVLEQILLHLPIKDILNCRLLSQEWRLFMKASFSARRICRQLIRPKAMELLDHQWLNDDPTVINAFILSETESKFRKVSLTGSKDHVAMGFGSGAIRIWHRRYGRSKLIFPWPKPLKRYHFLAPSPHLILIDHFLIAFYHHLSVGYVYDCHLDGEHIQSIDIAGKCIVKAFKLNESTFALATRTAVETYAIEDHRVASRTLIPAPNGRLDSVSGDRNLIFIGNAKNKWIHVHDANSGELLLRKSTEGSPNLIEFHYPFLAVSDQMPVLSYRDCPKCVALYHIDDLETNIWFSQDNAASRNWRSYQHLIIPQSWNIVDIRLNSRIMVLVTGSNNTDVTGPIHREIRFHVIPVPPYFEKFRIRAAIQTLKGRGRRMRNPVLLLAPDTLILEVQRDRLEEWNFWITNEAKLNMRTQKCQRMREKQKE
ncbi:hypothetical protein TCAL_09487, partial [Tigriopus californicus]|eukprot:TCALIF_09487-PA protein Name:"Protein of unknown function" AED:0.30 eAED:0.30 QI:19/1/0/1/1/0/2/0/465